MRRFNSWELIEFQSISFCNTFGLHTIKTANSSNVLILDINGMAHWPDQGKTINLKEHLDDKESSCSLIDEMDGNYADFDLELVASDSYLISETHKNEEQAVYLATCWIVYDQLSAPERYFAALFRISLDDFSTKLAAKFNLYTVPTYTRLVKNPTNIDFENKKLYWLVFAYSSGNFVHSVEMESGKVNIVEGIDDIFPFLDIQDFPGSTIRSHCIVLGDHRLSLIGYDTGYVIASICLMKDGVIIDRKSLKFDGPISILKLIDIKETEGRVSVLVSSTIGPTTVWELQLQEDVLNWEQASILLESELYDTVITAAVHQDLLFIGTYGELLLIYSLKEVLDGNEISPIHTVNIASPILSICSFGTQLLVLSNKGLHRLKPTFIDGPLEDNEHPEPSVVF